MKHASYYILGITPQIKGIQASVMDRKLKNQGSSTTATGSGKILPLPWLRRLLLQETTCKIWNSQLHLPAPYSYWFGYTVHIFIL